MRRAIIERLKETPAVTAVVGQRVYGRQGLLGGVSRDLTPEAFNEDEQVMTSLVVVLESRVVRTDGDSRESIGSTQTFQVWAVGVDYPQIKQALHAARAALHRSTERGAPLRAVEEPDVKWTDTRWASTSPELHDEALRAPTMFMRFDATITEPLT